MSYISCDNITLGYDREKEVVVENLSFTVNKGDYLLRAAGAADHFGRFLLLICCRLFRAPRIHLTLLLRLPIG